MAFIYISLYLCLPAALVAIGALLVCSIIEAIKERRTKKKDMVVEYYKGLWKKFQRENRAICKAKRQERKQARKTDRERERKRRAYEREDSRFRRALNHIDKGWKDPENGR